MRKVCVLDPCCEDVCLVRHGHVDDDLVAEDPVRVHRGRERGPVVRRGDTAAVSGVGAIVAAKARVTETLWVRKAEEREEKERERRERERRERERGERERERREKRETIKFQECLKRWWSIWTKSGKKSRL